MFLDEFVLKKIAISMGLSEAEQDFFVENYYDALSKFILNHIVGYIAEHEPERMEEIDNKFKAADAEGRIKGRQILLDQMRLFVSSYQDLEEDIRDITREYDNALFFTFIADGPKEDVLEVLDYLIKKISQVKEYQEIMETLKEKVSKRFSQKAVDEFFN